MSTNNFHGVPINEIKSYIEEQIAAGRIRTDGLYGPTVNCCAACCVGVDKRSDEDNKKCCVVGYAAQFTGIQATDIGYALGDRALNDITDANDQGKFDEALSILIKEMYEYISLR